MNFHFPSGNWAVIMQHVKDRTGPGEMIHCNISKQAAESLVELYNIDRLGYWNYWAINVEETSDWRYDRD